MKKKYLLIALAAIVVLLGIGTTAAYFNATDTSSNVFAIGDVKIELREDSWDPSDEHVMKPGAVFDKDPLVKNIGSNPAYVRISVEMSDYSILKDSAGTEGFEPKDMFQGYDESKWLPAGEAEFGDDDTVTYSYYYSEALEPGQETEPLFSKILFPETMDVVALDEIEETFVITVNADAIQSESFDGVEEAFTAFDNEA